MKKSPRQAKSHPNFLSERVKKSLSEKKHPLKTLKFAEALGLYNDTHHKKRSESHDGTLKTIRHRARVQTSRVLKNARLFPLWRIRETAQFLELKPSEWLRLVLTERIRAELNRKREDLLKSLKKNRTEYERRLAEYNWSNVDPSDEVVWDNWREEYLKELGLAPEEVSDKEGTRNFLPSQLFDDEKEILHRYRTISPESQEAARTLILQFDQRISDSQLQSSYRYVCPQILSEINFASTDLSLHLSSFFVESILKMLEERVHIKILLLAGGTDPADASKFHRAFKGHMQGRQLQVKCISKEDFFTSWSNGFEIWVLKKEFLSRLGLSMEKWEAVGFWWHFDLESRHRVDRKKWERGSAGDNVRMSFKEAVHRREWFNYHFERAERYELH